MAINDLNKVLNESGIRRIVTNMRNTINSDFSGIAGVGLGTAGVASLIHMSPLLLGMAGAGIAVAYKSIAMPSEKKFPTQFNYLNSVRQNFKC